MCQDWAPRARASIQLEALWPFPMPVFRGWPFVVCPSRFWRVVEGIPIQESLPWQCACAGSRAPGPGNNLKDYPMAAAENRCKDWMSLNRLADGDNGDLPSVCVRQANLVPLMVTEPREADPVGELPKATCPHHTDRRLKSNGMTALREHAAVSQTWLIRAGGGAKGHSPLPQRLPVLPSRAGVLIVAGRWAVCKYIPKPKRPGGVSNSGRILASHLPPLPLGAKRITSKETSSMLLQ